MLLLTHEDLTTRKPGRRKGGARPKPIPTLTVVSHPDASRVGVRAVLAELVDGLSTELSRTTPDFVHPEAAWGEPLADSYLSRSPLRLRGADEGGIEIRVGDSPTRLRVDGQRVSDERVLSPAEVRHGVVLELAERIVLLLHEISPDAPPGPAVGGLEGASEGIVKVRSAIRRVADLEVSVLLRGESGTGKELAARAIHDASSRRAAPFVAVNLGAVPPSLAAAELFGAAKGAFTGAVQARQGYFRAARGGTLFLDEVGEAPAEVQVLLLRALETGEITPVGSQQAQRVDLRLVAATDSDLEARVRAGHFKEPLLHRLAAYEIWLPPLRERRDDIGRLFHHFAAAERRALGEAQPADRGAGEGPWLPANLAARLVRYDWPGNVRQLRNVVRQLVIDGRGREQLRAGARVGRLLSGEPASRGGTPEAPRRPPPRRLAEIDFAELESALEEQRYNLAATARLLGISRPSLYSLLRQHPTLRTAEEIPVDEIAAAVAAVGGDLAVAARDLRISRRALRRRLSQHERS